MNHPTLFLVRMADVHLLSFAKAIWTTCAEIYPARPTALGFISPLPLAFPLSSSPSSTTASSSASPSTSSPSFLALFTVCASSSLSRLDGRVRHPCPLRGPSMHGQLSRRVWRLYRHQQWRGALCESLVALPQLSRPTPALQIPVDATEACSSCSHAWYSHTITPREVGSQPIVYQRGGCGYTACGGFYSVSRCHAFAYRVFTSLPDRICPTTPGILRLCAHAAWSSAFTSSHRILFATDAGKRPSLGHMRTC